MRPVRTTFFLPFTSIVYSGLEKIADLEFSKPDMVFTDEQKSFFDEKDKAGIIFSKFPANKWPNNEVPYTISGYSK